jgi:hypothetical protein
MAKDGNLTSFKILKNKNGVKISESRLSTNLPESYRNLSEK